MEYCRDVSVIRRADCWTDHKLLKVKVVLQVFLIQIGKVLEDIILLVTSYLMLRFVLHIMNLLWRELLPCETRTCLL